MFDDHKSDYPLTGTVMPGDPDDNVEIDLFTSLAYLAAVTSKIRLGSYVAVLPQRNPGGGLELWRETYAPFGLRPWIVGNTGTQMGGWFRREIRTLEDFRGLKMRVAGLGAEVLREVGAVPVVLPGAEIFTALETGNIDATEWSGPFNDMAWGLHQVAEYYYYPGWHEPSGTLECMVSTAAYDTLPADLQAILAIVCRAENDRTTAEFAARNATALTVLREQGRVQIRPFPQQVLAGLAAASERSLAALADADPRVRRVYDSYTVFQRRVENWQRISQAAVFAARR